VARYVIHYTLDGERRWDFANLQSNSVAEALQALLAIHGQEQANAIKDIKVTKAL
jgi:hypothetical protein